MSESCEGCKYHLEDNKSLGFCNLEKEHICPCPNQKQMEQIGCEFYEKE